MARSDFARSIKLFVADLYRVNEEVVSGESREWVLSPDSMIIDTEGELPEDLADIVKGYFLPFRKLPTAEEELAAFADRGTEREVELEPAYVLHGVAEAQKRRYFEQKLEY